MSIMLCKICGSQETDNPDGICDDCKFNILDNKDIPPNFWFNKGKKKVVPIYIRGGKKVISWHNGQSKDKWRRENIESFFFLF